LGPLSDNKFSERALVHERYGRILARKGDKGRLYPTFRGHKKRIRKGSAKFNPTAPGGRDVPGMVDKSETKPRRLIEAAEAFKQMLIDAEAVLRAGDTQEGERRAKAGSALVKAVRDVAELEAFARAQPPEDDEQALRAEFLGRIRRLAEAQRLGAPDEVLERIAGEGAAP
jgi:hypothetical protein